MWDRLKSDKYFTIFKSISNKFKFPFKSLARDQLYFLVTYVRVRTLFFVYQARYLICYCFCFVVLFALLYDQSLL